MWRKCWCRTAVIIAVMAVGSSPVQAQIGDPFASLNYAVIPACPFPCDSVTLKLSGELTSTSWKLPVLTGWDRAGDSISVYINVEFDTDPALPVLVPFELAVQLGLLPEGAYRVFYIISIINPLPTMPPAPPLIVEDDFRVAPPGDQNCDGVVDVRDVVRLVLYIFRGGPPVDPHRRADVTCDGIVDVSDIVQLVYMVFRNGTVCDPCSVQDLLPINITYLPPDSLRRDSFELMGGAIFGDTLDVTIAHGGGCRVHAYAVFMTPPVFEGSIPRVAHLYPQHIDPGDPCDAWVTETLRVDLRLALLLYRFYYGSLDDITLRIHGYDPAVSIDVLYQAPPP